VTDRVATACGGGRDRERGRRSAGLQLLARFCRQRSWNGYEDDFGERVLTKEIGALTVCGCSVGMTATEEKTIP
jgi:hypothetical protein